MALHLRFAELRLGRGRAPLVLRVEPVLQATRHSRTRLEAAVDVGNASLFVPEAVCYERKAKHPRALHSTTVGDYGTAYGAHRETSEQNLHGSL